MFQRLGRGSLEASAANSPAALGAMPSVAGAVGVGLFLASTNWVLVGYNFTFLLSYNPKKD